MKKLLFILPIFLLVGCSTKSINSNTQAVNETTMETTSKTVEKETATKKEIKKEVNIATGSYVLFGSYEQDNNFDNGKEPIEWFVLAVNDDGYLLMSRYALDCVQMNDTDRDFTYETSKLRNWLNNDFYNEAFNEDENRSIITSTLKDIVFELKDLNAIDKKEAILNDKIFVLNIEELSKYIPTEFRMTLAGTDRRMAGDFEKLTCKPTPYAVERGTYVFNNRCWYHLRDIMYDIDNNKKEEIQGTGAWCFDVNPSLNYIGVRPVIFVDKNNELLQEKEYEKDNYKYDNKNEYTMIYLDAFAGKYGYDTYSHEYPKKYEDIIEDGMHYPYEVLDVNEDLKKALETHEEEVVIADQAHNEKYKKIYLDSLVSLNLPEGVENADYKTISTSCDGKTVSFPRIYRLGYNFSKQIHGKKDDSFNLNRTDFPDGLQDNDGNGIDDRDPINSLGCIDRNYDGQDDRTWLGIGDDDRKNMYKCEGLNIVNGERKNIYLCFKCKHGVINYCEDDMNIVGSENNYKSTRCVKVYDYEESKYNCPVCKAEKDNRHQETKKFNMAIVEAGGISEYAGYSVGMTAVGNGKTWTYIGDDYWQGEDGAKIEAIGCGKERGSREIRWGGTGAAGSSK